MSYMKIEIWGTYPPPIGGVSIHIYRLIHSLHTIDSSVVLRNFGKQVSNISYVKHVSYPWMEFLLLPFRKKRIIHLHSNNIFAFALFLLFGGRHKVGVTLHNQNLIKKTSFIKKKIIQVFLRHAAFVVLNDDNYLLKLCSHFHCSRNNFHILPAFLPPTQAEYIGLSEDILFFRKQHSFLLSANAYKLRYENGIDIYGFDLLIQLVKSLKEKGINVGLVFCLPMIGDMEYYQKCLSSIKEMNIDDNILVVQRVFGGRHKVGVTLHNQNLIKKTSFIKKKIIQVFLRHAAFVVLNDDNYLLKLCSHFHCSRNNFHILPAFLPPTQAEYIGLSEDILFFRKQHSFLLSANAYKLRYENGIDIYGFDLLIQLVKSLKEKGINVGLVFCLPMIGDMEYYQKCLSSIKEMNIDDNILVVQREIPNGFEIWKLSDLFIRPTYTDIEGISVKEALFCGTPAVASDVCKRPSEAVLFKNRSYEDLEEKVLGFYNGSNYSSEGGISIDNRVPEQLLEIYEKCK